MKKSKAKEIDLFYLGNEKEKKKDMKKAKAGNKKPAKKASKKINENGEEIFNFDNEIVIGVKKIEDEPKKKIKKSKKVQKKKENKKTNKNKTNVKNTTRTQLQKPKSMKELERIEKKSKKTKSILKWSFLIIILVGTIIAFMLSPVFNVKKITVLGNEQISTEEIISLAQIKLDENTFKMNRGNVEKQIKENAYIESVKISRILPSEIKIEIVERTATYMIEYGNVYVYINNQGYMLEKSEEKLPIPILIGCETMELEPGNRLIKEDLYKLETILEIMYTAASNEIEDLITKIDISNKTNIILILETEQKIVYIGDASDIKTRILYLKKLLEKEQGVNAEFFINGDINTDRVYVREQA